MACGEWMPTWGVGNHLALELGNHVALKLGNDLTPELGNHLTLKMGNQVAPELGNQLALRSSKVGNIRGPRQKRRIIFIEVSAANGALDSPFDDFSINSRRTPLFFVDAHLHTNEILRVQDTPVESGWGTVPTPMF